MLGKKTEVSEISTALRIVAIATVVMGIIKPFNITVSVKNPKTYPTIVRIRQLKPKGIPVTKSRIRPPAKPVISPKVRPFKSEK